MCCQYVDGINLYLEISSAAKEAGDRLNSCLETVRGKMRINKLKRDTDKKVEMLLEGSADTGCGIQWGCTSLEDSGLLFTWPCFYLVKYQQW